MKDLGLQDAVTGLSIYRGEGYFCLHNQNEGTQYEAIRGNFQIYGAKITKAINLSYEIAEGGVGTFGAPGEDWYSMPNDSSGTTGNFITTALPGYDGVYVYYQFDPKIGGGCQCQDKIDNDGNGKIDFPQDFGCDSALDDEEKVSDSQVVDYPVCRNGIDDDGDGSIDYPNDPGCESVIDNSENESVKVCKIGEGDVALTVSGVEVSNTKLGDVEAKIYAGGKIYNPDDDISLVVDGSAVVDNTIAKPVPGLSIKRGPGYVYILLINEKDKIGTEYFKGRINIFGVKITKVLNGMNRLSGLSSFFIGGSFEIQADTTFDEASGSWQKDEYTLNNTGNNNYIDFISTTSGGSDSMYIYYDYTDTVSGGCKCQDGIDNDSDGLVDYPNDPGCISAEDDGEENSIVELITNPTKIVPGLISSGPGFWVLIGIIVLISGIVIYVIIKSDRDKQIK